MNYKEYQMQRLVAITSILFMSACAVQPVTLPSGNKGATIDCSGSMLNWGLCYKRAGDYCPKGYNVISGGESTTPMVTANQFGLYANTYVSRSMIIECK